MPRKLTNAALATCLVMFGTTFAGDDLLKDFLNPPREYSPVPFWFLNGDLKEGQITWQLEQMSSHGVYGAFMHARTGLVTPYLSERWWEVIGHTVRKAEELGVQMWLYDEYNWPSGAAKGRVPGENPKFRDRRLVINEKRIKGPTSVDWQLPEGTFATVAARLVEGRENQLAPESFTDVTKSVGDGRLRWNAPEGDWILCAFTEETGNYVDLMSQEAIARFIEMTHKEYEKRYKKYFPKTIPGIFSDEPAFHKQPAWSADFLEEFRKRRGYDLAPYLPALYYDAGDITEKIRIAYFQTVAELYAKAYFKPIHDWCEGLGTAATGHLLAQENLSGHIRSSGDPFTLLQWEQTPAMDCVGGPRRIDMTVPKLISSIAALNGRNRVLSETFAGCGWALNFEEMRWMTTWQYVFGVNLLTPHAFHYTIEEEAQRNDWPPSMFYQQPYWQFYKLFADYVSRLSFMLSQGEPVVDVAVLYPITSAWASHSWKGKNPLLGETNNYYHSIADRLLRSQVDFQFIDEPTLAKATIEGNELAFKGFRYKTLILPPVVAVREGTLEKVAELTKAGGRVIAVRRLPIATAEKGRDPEVAAQVENIFGIGPLSPIPREVHNKGQAYVIKGDVNRIVSLARGATPDFFIYPYSGDVFYCHRRTKDANWYFVVNQTPTRFITYATIRCKGEPEIWNPEGGTISVAHGYKPQENTTIVPLDLEPYQAIFVVFRRPEDPKRIRRVSGLKVTSVTETRSPATSATIVRGLAYMRSGCTVVMADGRKGKVRVDDLPQPLLVDAPWDFKTDKPFKREAAKIVQARYRIPSADDDTSKWSKVSFDDSSWDKTRIGEPLPTLSATWLASWLRFNGDNQSRCFRKKINLKEDVAEAKVTITGDNYYEIFVNGKRAGAETDNPEGWRQAETYTITNLLKKGDNIFAVRLGNAGSVAGLLAQARIQLKSGKVVRLLTDATWKMSKGTSVPDEWTELGFNDSAWGGVDVVGPPPAAPWGDVSGLPPAPQTGAEIWYRFGLPPGAFRLHFPEETGAKSPKLYVGDAEIPLDGLNADLSRISAGKLKVAVLKIDGGAPLKSPIVCHCKRGRIAVGSWADQGFAKYSGSATYTLKLTLPPEYRKEHIVLDLGDVGIAAKVWVNGKEVGARLWRPYTFDINKCLTAKGADEIRVLVSNTLANRFASNAPEASKWDRIPADKLASGIIGPVRIVPYREVEIELKK